MKHQYEAIIVGAGGAGLYAALEASRSAKTAALSKLHPIRSHIGAAAVLNDRGCGFSAAANTAGVR